VSEPVHGGEPAEALRAAFDGAFARPARAPDVDTVALLAIRVAGAPMAVRVLETAGIMQVRPIVPVPGRRPELLGVAGVRGALVPVYSLARLLGRADDDPPRWLVLAGTTRGERVGLAVTTFERHLLHPAGDLRPATGSGAGEAHAPELLVADGKARPVLSIPSLLRKITGR
jgi:purine-binding chemotaxis protein CheW